MDMEAILDTNDGTTAFSIQDSDSVEVIRLTSDGEAGFGTTPSTQLDVDSPDASTTAVVTIESGAGGGDFQIFVHVGDPDGTVTGSPGDLSIDPTGGNMYIKATGAASTSGWLILTTAGSAVMSLEDLSDVGVSTATAGNILIADGSDFDSRAFSGDIVADGGAVVTIQADAVALATDTTGNFVASIFAGAGVTTTGVGGENITHTLSIELKTVSQDAAGTTGSPSGMEFLAGDLTLLQGCDDDQVLKWDEVTDRWQCASDNDLVMELNDLTDVGQTTATAGNILIADGTDFDSRAVSGDILIDGGAVVTIQPDAVVLATDTSGNYVATISAGSGITTTGAGSGENITHTLSVELKTVAEDAVGTTGSPSGLEFVSGDLTILQGCNNNQIIQWDETSDRWQCQDVTAALSGLSDVGTSTATAGNILVADGTNFDSRATSGDIMIDGGAVVTIQPNAVALATDTTGNFVASVFAGAGITTTGAGGEDITHTLSIELKAVSQDGAGTTGSPSGMEFIAGDLTLVQGCADEEVLMWDETNDRWQCQGVVMGLGGLSDFGTTTATAGNILVADGTDFDSRTASGDIMIDGGAVVTIQPDAVALATDTTGNFVASVFAGNGITTTGAGGEDITHTLAVELMGTAQDGVGTTGSVSGMEFISGDLTLVQGCSDEQVLMWDETNDRWQCQGVVMDIDNLMDIGTSTATAGNILVADGTDFDSRTVTGDIGIDGGAVVTIQADAVALATDTTGNFVASVFAGAGITTTGAGGENITHTLSVELKTVSQDGAGTTGSPSGLEFIAGDLTVLQGCSDNQIIQWDESTDRWQCQGVTAALEDLFDVGTSTATSGNLLVADGSNFDSRTVSGDVLIDGGAATTIQPDAVALATDTTGNFVASVFAGNGITTTGAGGEDITHTLAVELMGTAQDGVGTTGSVSGMEFISGDLTLVQGCDDEQVLMWDETNDRWQCAGVVMGLGGLSDVGTTTSTDGNILIASGSDFDSRAVAGDILLDSGGNTTIQPDAVALATDTTGNFVASVFAGAGITTTGAGGENITHTLSVELKTVSQDGAGTTGTPSGLEFIAGDLTIIQGCTDNQIIQWDEATDRWQCQDVTAALDGLFDVGTSTATAGNILVADGTNFDSRATSGDIMIDGGAVVTIQPDAVALATDTTGNFVASIFAGAGITTTGAGGENITHTLSIELKTVSQDGLTTTGSPSGMEFVAGDLTLVQGCADQEVMMWNETTDRWQCQGVVLGLGNLTDIGTTTATAGNILVADGTNFDSRATSGDIMIDGGAVVTIQPDAVALATDTTGNYVASVFAGAGITTTGAGGENVTHTLSVELKTVSQDGAGTTGSPSGLEFIAGDLTLLQGCADEEVLMWDETTDRWQCFSVVMDIDNLMDVGTSTATAGNIFVADGTDFDSRAVAGDINIDGGANVTIQPDAVALATDTTGNFVASVFAGAGITTTGAGGENITHTLSIELKTVSQDGLTTTGSPSGLEFVAGDLTLLQGCSDGQALFWDEPTDRWQCEAISLDELSDLGTTTATAGNIFVADGTDFDSRTASGDIMIDGGAVVTIQPNAVALATDTTGNFVASIFAGAGITTTGAGGEDITHTLSVELKTVSQDGAGTTGSPSGLEFIAGDLTLMQGCADEEVLMWDETTDRWQCSSVVMSLDGLSDVGTTTSVDGNILIASGDDFDSRAVAGDILLDSGGNTTIQPDAVALATDTTGNFVASVFAGAGITTTGAGGENITHTLSVELKTVSQDGAGTTGSPSGLEFIAGDLTLLQGCADEEALMWDETTDRWQCQGVTLDDLTDIGTSTATSGNILVADGTNFDSRAMSGDVLIDGGAATTIQPDSVALATDTTGNFVASIFAGAGITTTGAGGENITHTLSVELKTVSQDGLTTTGSPSGLEFVAGDLTLVQGCSDGEALFWDEPTDRWQCEAISLDELSDLGTTTATAGNIFVADGTDFDSRTASGDIMIDGGAVVTIQPDAVALATDTTGNYVASVFAGAGITTTGAGGENVTHTLSVELKTVSQDGAGTTGSPSGMEFIAGDLTLMQGCSDQEVLMWDETTDRWQCSAVVMALDALDDVGTTTATAGNILVADGTDFDSRAASGDIMIDGGAVVTIQPDAVALATDTTGNFVASVFAGAGITTTGAGGENITHTLSVELKAVSQDGAGTTGSPSGMEFIAGDLTLMQGCSDQEVLMWDETTDRWQCSAVVMALDALDDVGTTTATAGNILVADGTNFDSRATSGDIMIDGGAVVTIQPNAVAMATDTTGNFVASIFAGAGITTTGAGGENITHTLSVELKTVSQDGAGTTGSPSGLEFIAGDLSILQGCTDDQILRWDEVTDRWQCSGVTAALSDLGDVGTSTATAGNILVADGTNFDSRATSGDIMIDGGAVVTIQPDAVALATDTTGNFVASVFAGAGITTTGAGGENITHTLSVELKTVSQDGAGTTGSPSGLEFIAGDLTLMQGCADEEVLMWDETTDRWQCSSVVMSLDGLSDVGTTTSVDGNILIASGDDFDSRAVAGDILLDSGGNTTIQPDAVALATDTTGNFVASVFAGAGITTTGAGGENITHTLSVELKTVSQDGAGTTGSPSGLEFIAGDLTILQGCTDLQILQWDEVTDRWQCQSVAASLGDLSDVGTSTPTSGNILVAEGSEFDSRAMSGDVLIDGGAATTIQPDAVALATDTTGNFVASVFAGAGITTTGAGGENITHTLSVELKAVSQDGAGTTGSPSGMEFIAGDLTLMQGCADQEVLMWDETTDRWQCSAVVMALDALDDVGTTTATAGNILIADGTNFDSRAVSGDVLIDGGAVVTIQPDAVALATDTTGNFVASVFAGAGITTTGAGGENITHTLSVELKTVSQDGAGTTGSPSGLEFVAGDLSILQGCTDDQIIRWDEVTDRWQCSGVTAALSDLGDVGTSTATAGNILVADGTNFDSRTVSGDVLIDGGAVTTIQPDAVALATDTTGNYVASVFAGAGITTTGAGGENVTHTLSVELKTVSQDGAGTTGSPSGLEFIAGDLTLMQGCADEEVLMWDETTDRWQCSSVVMSLDGLSDVGTTTSVDGNILIASGDDFDSRAVAGDILLDSGGNTTIQPDAVALATDTTGNYVASVFAGAGITTTGAGGENITHTLSVELKAVSQDGAGTTGSPSGLEFIAGDLTLLQGCTDLQVLQWDETTDRWQCQSVAASLADLSDVGTTTPTSGNILVAEGSEFDSRAMSGDVLIDGGAATTIQPDAVALATDTTGNYVASVFAGAGITTTGAGGENITHTLSVELKTVSQDGAGTTGSPSGLEFIAGDLTLMQGCADEEVLMWDETTDRWQCSSVVMALDGLSDVGTTTATAGNILIADGTNFDSRAVSGDVLIDGGAVVTIQPDAVALATDTTGNYVASVFAGAGITTTGAGGENVTHTLSVELKTVSQDGAGTTGSPSGLEFIAGDLTLMQGCADEEVLMWDETSDRWQCQGITLDDLTDIGTTTTTSGNILVADGTDFDSRAMSGDVLIDGGAATTIQPDAVALATDTTGNFVASVFAGSGITTTGAGGENITHTLSVALKVVAENAVGSTGSVSGLEFESGELTLVQGCDDGEILKWDEAGDRWQCSADAGAMGAVTDLDDLDDVSQSTALDGNILIAFGGSYSNQAVLGDINISGSGSVTIQADAVALATDTTGNFVASVFAGAGITTTGAGGENITHTLSVELKTVSQDGAGTTGSPSGLEFIAGDLTLMQGCADEEVLMWDETTDRWQCSSVVMSLDALDDIGTTTATSGNILVADGTNFDSRTMSGDVLIDGGAATTIQPDAVALATDTTGNFVASVFAGAGITTTGAGGENITHTLSVELKTVSQDGAGTTGSPSGLEFIAGDLTLMQGCADEEVLMWDETTDRWQCSSVVMSLDGLSDIGTTTATAGNILVADGTNFDSRTMSGDVLIDGGAVTTIQPDAVALATDTTGNFVASVFAGAGITTTGAGGENITHTLSVELKTVSQDGAGTTGSPSGLEFIAGDLTLLQGCADEEVLMWDETTDRWQCFNVVMDLDNISDIGTSTATAGNILIADGTNFDSRAMSGDVLIDGGAVTTIQPDAVALATDTTGNYVASVFAGSGITTTGAGGENITHTLSIELLSPSVSGTGGTGSPSGMEFIVGELTLIQGCADEEVLMWDETTDRWKCNGVVANLQGLEDVGTTTATAGNILIADGTDFDSRAVSGDILIDGGAVVTIQPDAVALATDTTGNFVASVFAGSGITTTGAGGENITHTLSVELKTVSQDGAGTTGSPSGMEFIAGDLTLMQGCSDQEVLMWDETTDRWQCSAVVMALDALDDVGTTTATAGNILIADGTNFDSRAMSGDVLIDGGAVTTIQPDAVALATDTTGNYVASVFAGSGITTTGAGGENITHTLSVELKTVSQDGAGTTGSPSGMEFIAGDLTLMQGCADEEVLMWDETTDRWQCSAVVMSLDALDDVGTTTATAGNILIADGTDFDSRAVSGDILIDGGAVVTIQPDAVALATDTTGNFVASVFAGAGITTTGAGGENITHTLSVELKTVSQDGAGTTGSPSGLEFIAGDLTLMQGCLDDQILRWDEVTDRWQCTGVVADFDDLSDVGTSTATAGNIFVADGTDFDSRAVAGDINIDGGANVTIQPDAVALATDTTGNYVASVFAGAGITTTGAGGENITHTLSVELKAVSQDGAGTTGSPSGMEFIAGDLTLLQGCADEEVLMWDETTDRWQCFAPVMDLDNLTDVGTSTAAAGNILIADGTNFDSRAVSGDILIDGGAVVTIQPDAVALATDTTGNYVASVFAGAGITTTGAGGENITHTLSVELKTVSQDGAGTTGSPSGLEFIAGDLTLLQGCADEEVLMWDETTDRWQCIGITLDDLTDIGTSTATAGNILIADGTDFDSRAMSGDILIDGGGATTVQPDAVALATDTTGNYVASVFAGAGITTTGAGGENVTHTLSVELKTVSQDGAGNTGSPSGLEFIAGDLTLMQGCADEEVLMWDETTDRWQCFAPVMDLDNLTDVGTSTATAGNILIADGTNFDSRAVSGDILIDGGAVVTIQPDAVALATDTTGNYVASIFAGAGITTTGAGGENITHTLSVELKTVSQDGLTTTGSPSGLEFVAGDLTIIQGCTDEQVLMWDETTDRWQCSAVVMDLDNLSDVGTSTATAGNILIADGTNFDSRAVSGDILIDGGAVVTIQPDAVALATDTTGNYVASVFAGAGITTTGAGGENITHTLSVELKTVSQDGAGTTGSPSGLEFIAGDLTLMQGCADEEVLMWDETTDRWQCSTVVMDLDNLSDVGTSTATAGNILIADGTDFDSRAVSGDILIDGGAVVTIQPDAVALATDTTGNYVASIFAGAGITTTGAGGENITHTLSVELKTVSQDGLTTTGSPSGLEFVAGDLTIIQGCTDEQVLMWDETTDRWQCSAVVMDLDNLSDVGTSTATAGNILIADGTDFDSRAVSGDILIDGGAVVTIQPDAVALATDTTGNYVASIFAGAGITTTGAGGENITHTLSVELKTVSQDGLTTTGSPSGLEFVAGDLTIIQGCTDEQVLMWDETTDRWQCSAVVMDLDNLSDVGTSTATAGNILISDGTDFDSRAVSGDILIDGGAVVTIQPDAVALATDTTGNFVASVFAGAGITTTGAGGENITHTLSVELKTVSQDGAGTTGSPSGMEFIAGDLTLMQGCTDEQVLMWDETTDRWQCQMVVMDLDNLSDVGTSTATAGNILIADGTNFDSRAISGDVLIDGGAVVTIQPDSVTLATDTTGNFVASVFAGNGITTSGAGGENITHTISVELKATPEDGVGVTFSPSGLEFESGDLTLLQGCADNEILKWSESSDTWRCVQEGGMVAVEEISANTTLDASNFVVLVDTNGGNVTVTLPAAASNTGRMYHIKKIDPANTVSVDGAGAETIDGQAVLSWTTDDQSFTIVCDGTEWHIL